MVKSSLGIIGGMGPKAGVTFLENVMDKTDANSDAQHIETYLLSNTRVPDRTAAIKAGEFDEVFEELLRSVRGLESLGVSNIVMACNTAHHWLPALQKVTSVPIIDMLDETAKHIKAKSSGKNSRVGILATDGVISTGLYDRALAKHGLTPVTPNSKLQEKAMEIIYDQVKKTGVGNLDDFKELTRQFVAEGNLDFVVLGCTEFSYFSKNFDLPEMFVEAMDVATKTAIEQSGYKYKGSQAGRERTRK